MKRLKKILLVEDDEIVIFLTMSILYEMGIVESIKVVKDGEGAIFECLSTDTPADLILLDCKMPIMDGFEFLKIYNTNAKLKSDSTKIVMVSSSGLKSEIVRALGLGVCDYIEKPLSECKINALLEKHFTLNSSFTA